MMKSYIKKYNGNILFFCLLLVLATVHFHQKNLLTYTGDEPRFTYYSYSIIKGEMLKYPKEKFVKETGSGIPSHSIFNKPITLNIFNKTMFMMNSIVAPLLYAPALFFGKAYKAWELLRTAAFLYYCGALIFIWLSLKTIFSTKEALLALAITTLFAPQIVQMSLGNTEQIAIFFLASAFYFLLFRQLSIFSIIIGTISMCLVVFSSMRAMPLAGSVAMGFLARVWMLPTGAGFNKRKGLFTFMVISIIGAFGWIALQLSFTGTIVGSSLLNESLIGKPPIWFLHRLFVPLLNHKDGIFLLFPLVFLSFLGLINAALKRNLIALVFLGAWLIYYFLISLTGQSEGYPGRLQFVLVEFFIVGLAFYIRDFRNVAAKGILILGVIISSIGVYMHLQNPGVLVMNRQFGLFQQMILEKTHILDFGRYIIWDKHSIWTIPAPPLFLSKVWHEVFYFLAIVGTLLLLSISKRCGIKIQKSSAWCALLVSLIGTSSLFVSHIPQKAISITRSCVDGCGSVKLIFTKPIDNKTTITFGTQPFWQPPQYPSFFTVIVELENGTLMQYQKRSMPEIRLPALGKMKSITISGDKAKMAWNTLPVKVYVGLVPI